MKRYFLLRVELHELPKDSNGKPVDSRPIYERLHNELLSRNCYKKIRGGSGIEYLLPDGVYEGFVTKTPAEFTGDNAREVAARAVDATVKWVKEEYPSTEMRGSILAVEIAGEEEYWQGLERA